MFRRTFGIRSATAIAVVLIATLAAAGPTTAASSVIWKKWLTSTTGNFRALAAAPGGGVFAAIGRYPFGMVRRYSATGAVVWSKTVTGDSYMTVRDIDSDSTGAYVVGFDGSGKARDGRAMWVRKFRNDGSVAWTARWGTVDGEEQARSLAVHDGVVYAFYDPNTYVDLIARFDAATGQRKPGGDLQVPFDQNDYPMWSSDIDVNDAGITVFMGGAENGGTSPALLLKRLTFGGTVTWTRRITTGTIHDYVATSMSLDSHGIVIAFLPDTENGHPRVARYTLGGTKVFDRPLPGNLSGPAVGDGTSVYALYETAIAAPTYGSIGIQRLSATGDKQGKSSFGTPKNDVGYSILPVGSALYVGGAAGFYDFSPLLAKVRKPAAN